MHSVTLPLLCNQCWPGMIHSQPRLDVASFVPRVISAAGDDELDKLLTLWLARDAEMPSPQLT